MIWQQLTDNSISPIKKKKAEQFVQPFSLIRQVHPRHIPRKYPSYTTPHLSDHPSVYIIHI